MKVTRWFLFTAMVLFVPTALLAQGTTQKESFQAPESYQERVKAAGNVLELTMKDAIRLALTNNLELEIENYNEDLNRQRVFGTKGFYDPILQFRVGWNSSERPSTSILDAGAKIPTTLFTRWTFNTTFDQNVVGGGALRATFNNDRSTTNSNYTFINPQFGSAFSLSFTQPLWRGFKQTQTERQLKILNLDTEISDSQFKQRVAEVIQQVESQYWELVFSIENYEARRRSLELAIVQYENNRKRVDIGVMAPIEITSSRAEVATREQEMIRSEVQIINAQNAFKRLLAPDPKDSIWNLSVLPLDQPMVREVQASMEEAIETALSHRPEVAQISLEGEKIDIDRKYYKKEGKPTVDLVLGLTSTGTAGQVLRSEAVDTNGDGVPDTIIDNVPQPNSPFFGNFWNSWGQSFGFDYLNYTAAVDVQIPIKNRANDAQLAQLAINERLLHSRLKNVQQGIIVEVRNAFEEIHTRRKGLEVAILARQLSQEQLDGETKRFEAGLSTNFEVLRYQRDLTDAQVSELRAKVDYELALAALQKATFTIVQDSDIVVARSN